MHDERGANRANDLDDLRPIADVDLMMMKVLDRLLKPALIPARVGGRTEKHLALIVVDAVYLTAARREVFAYFGADEAGRSGHETNGHQNEPCDQRLVNLSVDRPGSTSGGVQ